MSTSNISPDISQNNHVSSLTLSFLQACIEQSPVSTQVFNPDGWSIYVNQAWVDLFQASRTASLQFNILQDEQLQHAGLIPLIQQAFAGEVVTLPTVPYEASMTAVHGKGRRWLRAMFHPIKDGNGNVEAVGLQHFDVTEQSYEIERQKQEIVSLSTPVIPITEQAVIMPLIGRIDDKRAQQLLETMISGAAQYRAEIIIVDITGVVLVDRQVANTILQAAQAVKLLGAEVVLTGIRPEVAQALVGLEADLRGIVTRSSLQMGVAYAVKKSEGAPSESPIL